nr:radical SAM protein [Desulfobacterales bacterium]
LETLPFYDGDLSLYREFAHPKGWNRDAVRRFLSREFKKPAPIRRILNSDPPYFTSNHAAFLTDS